MSKKVESTEYLDEDYLFLILQLVDHPKLKRDKFTFSEIKKEKYKRANASDLFYEIVNFNDQGLLKIEKLKFNVTEGNEDDREFIQIALSGIKKYPKLKLARATKRIINNSFNLRDLKIVLLYKNHDQIFNFIGFDIEINKKFKQEHAKRLKKYLKLFAYEELESPKKNYLRVEFQKENIKKKIDEISRKTGHSLVLKSSDFNNEHRFFESILLLERERFLIIKNISSEKTEKNSFSYIIHCELKEKCNSRPPFYVTKKDMGFLRFSKHEKVIKIGKTDSQHFKLLKLLLKPFGKENGIDSVFEEIETKRIKKYPDLDIDDRMRKLEYVVKELQKNKRLGGRLKITLDKKGGTIWIDYIK